MNSFMHVSVTLNLICVEQGGNTGKIWSRRQGVLTVHHFHIQTTGVSRRSVDHRTVR